ncbi:MAG: 2-oxoacid:acceptor oxidoreductase family protein [Clostridia bacterium]|nr:2-oxoacid:acceptor oxidoreductase family protein [Clostridia bacterium]
MTTQILIAGFGGQGILFAGKFLSHEALIENKEVAWLPSYGPEMRGGTANCSVTISDSPIGSPIIANPDILIAMNLPSLDKYEDAVKPGGFIFVDSSLIERKVKRDDVTAVYIPATKICSADENLRGGADIILIGSLIRHTNVVTFEDAEAAFRKVVKANKPQLLANDLRALKIGYDY